MLDTTKRILAFLINDSKRAEGLTVPDAGPTPAWIGDAAKDEEYAKAAVEVARRSQDLADAAVKSLQDKAAAHGTLLLALVPFALTATLLALPQRGEVSFVSWAAFALLVVADICLLAALVMATLASGLVLAGGVSLTRLGDLAATVAPDAPGKLSIRAAEVEALRKGTLLSFASGSRVANDLYISRRLLVFAVLLAGLGLVVLVSFGGGVDVFRAPTPTP
jgi:hypothetical protein